MYVYLFIVLVILTLPIFKIPYIKESKISNYMLNNTPILSKLSSEMIDIYSNVYTIVTDKDDKTNEELNTEIIKLLLDRKVVTKASVKKLVNQNKIQISNKSIIE